MQIAASMPAASPGHRRPRVEANVSAAASGDPAPDAWSALIAACMSPNDYVILERDGELVVEPARRAS